MGSDVSQLGRDDARYVDCARRLTMAMLAGRAVDATLCPSEVARALTAADEAGAPDERWRMFMPHVHAAVDALVAVNRVQLSWKGEALPTRAGPYRIGYRSGVVMVAEPVAMPLATARIRRARRSPARVRQG